MNKEFVDNESVRNAISIQMQINDLEETTPESFGLAVGMLYLTQNDIDGDIKEALEIFADIESEFKKLTTATQDGDEITCGYAVNALDHLGSRMFTLDTATAEYLVGNIKKRLAEISR